MLLIISYILSNLGFPQKYLSPYYQIGPQNYTISTKKKPKIIYFVGKIQKAQQSPLKSSLLLGTSKSPLLHGTFKARCYTAPLKNPLPHGNIFTKSYKTQMLFWHLFYKAQYYFGTYLQKPKYYFGKNNYIILKSPKLFLGKNISSYTKVPNSWEI